MRNGEAAAFTSLSSPHQAGRSTVTSMISNLGCSPLGCADALVFGSLDDTQPR
jgi:hypothetical protein